MLFFEPPLQGGHRHLRGAVPGLNNVIRSASLHLHHRYGVPTVLGVRYGYQGLNPAKGDSATAADARIRQAHPQLRRHGAPLIARAGGTGGDRKTGQALKETGRPAPHAACQRRETTEMGVARGTNLKCHPLSDNLNIYRSDNNFSLNKPGYFSYTWCGNSVWRKPHVS